MRSSEIVMHTMETCAMESEFSEHLLGYLDFLDQCVSVNMCCATCAILNTACNLCCVEYCNGSERLMCACYLRKDSQIVPWWYHSVSEPSVRVFCGDITG